MRSEARGEAFFFSIYSPPAEWIGSLAIRAEVESRFEGQVKKKIVYLLE